MKPSVCPLCEVAMDFDTTDKEGNPVEKHVEICMHNPKLLQEDIKVLAHRLCYEKAKAVYPKFDQPTEADYASPKIPNVDRNGVVTLKDLMRFSPVERPEPKDGK